MKAYIISPHYDDALLSCFLLIEKLKKSRIDVEIINVFSNSEENIDITATTKSFLIQEYIKEDLNLPSIPKNKDIIHWIRERKTEDKLALNYLNIKKLDLNYPDAIFRNKNSTPLYKSEEELFSGIIHPAENKLIADITNSLLSISKDELLFFPMGNSQHIDHIILHTISKSFPRPSYYLDFETRCSVCPPSELTEINLQEPKRYLKKSRSLKFYKTQYDSIGLDKCDNQKLCSEFFFVNKHALNMLAEITSNSEEIIKNAQVHYKMTFSLPQPFDRFNSSIHQDRFILESNDNHYYLKEVAYYLKDEISQHLLIQSKLQQTLDFIEPIIPTFQNNLSIKIGNKTYRLSRWLTKKNDNVPHKTAISQLACLHKTLKEIENQLPKRYMNLSRPSFRHRTFPTDQENFKNVYLRITGNELQSIKHQDKTKDSLKIASESLNYFYNNCNFQLIHGDYHKYNLVNSDKLYIIDFEDLRYDSPVIDICWYTLLSEFFEWPFPHVSPLLKKTPTNKAIFKYLDEYNKHRKQTVSKKLFIHGLIFLLPICYDNCTDRDSPLNTTDLICQNINVIHKVQTHLFKMVKNYE